MSFQYQIIKIDTHAQNLIGWVALHDGNAIGHVFIHVEPCNKIKFMDAWVDDSYRRKGIYRKLWDTRYEYARQHYSGWLVYAWCKPTSIEVFLEHDFEAGDTATHVHKIIA